MNLMVEVIMRKILLIAFVAALTGFLPQTVVAQTQGAKIYGACLVQPLPDEPFSKHVRYQPQHVSSEEFNSVLSVKHEAGCTYLGSHFLEGKVLKVSHKPGFRRKNVTRLLPLLEYKGVNGYVACKLIDETAEKTYDFSKWRKWCRR